MTNNEEKIIALLKRKDEKTLYVFYHSYNRQLVRFIQKQTGSYHIAEELAQDVFLDFIESLRNFRGESSLKTYLFTIARYKVIDYIRKKKIKGILFSTLPRFFVENIASAFVDDDMEKKELVEKIDSVIHRLPNDYRVIIRLKYIDGEKVREIAKKMSLPFKATESLLFRARKAFVKLFNTV